MSDIDPKIMDRLEQLATEMAEFVALVKGPAPVFPAEAQEKVAKRICLFCGEKVALDQRYVRGLDAKHGLFLRDAIRAGETTERELIAMGYMAPDTPGGRKPANRSNLLRMLHEKRREMGLQPTFTDEEVKANLSKEINRRKRSSKSKNN